MVTAQFPKLESNFRAVVQCNFSFFSRNQLVLAPSILFIKMLLRPEIFGTRGATKWNTTVMPPIANSLKL